MLGPTSFPLQAAAEAQEPPFNQFLSPGSSLFNLLHETEAGSQKRARREGGLILRRAFS